MLIIDCFTQMWSQPFIWFIWVPWGAGGKHILCTWISAGMNTPLVISTKSFHRQIHALPFQTHSPVCVWFMYGCVCGTAMWLQNITCWEIERERERERAKVRGTERERERERGEKEWQLKSDWESEKNKWQRGKRRNRKRERERERQKQRETKTKR